MNDARETFDFVMQITTLTSKLKIRKFSFSMEASCKTTLLRSKSIFDINRKSEGKLAELFSNKLQFSSNPTAIQLEYRDETCNLIIQILLSAYQQRLFQTTRDRSRSVCVLSSFEQPKSLHVTFGLGIFFRFHSSGFKDPTNIPTK